MNSITLVSVTTRNIPAHVFAINKTMKALNRPCQRLMICPHKIPDSYGFRWMTVPEFSSWTYPASYNYVMLKRMFDFIDTDFIITVHDDGYGRNPNRWSDYFFRYDYIGAPWPLEWQCGGHHVGNGGFSLRSRQLLLACKEGPEPVGNEAEDVHICRTHRDYFEQRKCRFAPIPVALQFSIEYGLSQYPNYNPANSFGFHGKHHLNGARRAPPGAGLQKSDFTLTK